MGRAERVALRGGYEAGCVARSLGREVGRVALTRAREAGRVALKCGRETFRAAGWCSRWHSGHGGSPPSSGSSIRQMRLRPAEVGGGGTFAVLLTIELGGYVLSRGGGCLAT